VGKRLNGSSGTGDKILRLYSLFTYDLKEKEIVRENEHFYRFSWAFDGQFGFINITYNPVCSKISESSVINTEKTSGYKFSRPLGLYNDQSLFSVFKKMLESNNVQVLGAYR